MAGADGSARLMQALGRLDELLAQHRAEMPAELAHFLERRSYDKATQWCAGADEIKCGSPRPTT
jgi:hypothetical protein